MDINDIDPVVLLEKQVNNYIKNNFGEKLSTTLLAAETYLSDKKELLFNAFIISGAYKFNEKEYVDSILYYNKARKFNPTTPLPFEKIIEVITEFYFSNKDKFIKIDLIKLLPPIKMLCAYYKNIPDTEPTIKASEILMSSIAYRYKFVATEAVEGKMTYRVNLIVDALEKEVPMEQVKKEVSKFIADLIKKNKNN